MIIPLSELIDYKGNAYELSVAAIKRASQLASLKGKEVEEVGSKIVSLSLKQVLTKEVQFQLEEK
ncbi:DNA-directed RNA polymerase subunit omega [Spirochaetia bacterium 38H-sp]|uniref:DNA-directed RNA polymerase subunit omega n=1 Tax=Rarispira pelagica TaxID=3141764 RepID=A0ABU9UB08_9SPIR